VYRPASVIGFGGKVVERFAAAKASSTSSGWLVRKQIHTGEWHYLPLRSGKTRWWDASPRER
jgi:hypothetical protein